MNESNELNELNLMNEPNTSISATIWIGNVNLHTCFFGEQERSAMRKNKTKFQSIKNDLWGSFAHVTWLPVTFTLKYLLNITCYPQVSTLEFFTFRMEGQGVLHFSSSSLGHFTFFASYVCIHVKMRF